ncbi:MAG: hypothetical protein PVF43_06845 [Candidatus Eiseniibacteriota bacterium]|jgi:hypothetical protein
MIRANLRSPVLVLAGVCLLSIACVLLLASCSPSAGDLTGAGDDSSDGEAGAYFASDLDPAAETFVFRRLDAVPQDQEAAPVELVGSDLVVDPATETLSLDVALRNASDRPLYPAALVYLRDFTPASVIVLNPDGVDSTIAPGEPSQVASYIFDYSDLLGAEGYLPPRGQSGTKRWEFADPGLGAFSFAAQARFGLGEPEAFLGGTAFWDADGDGVRDPDEPPIRPGIVHVAQDGGAGLVTEVGEEGGWRVPIREPGLYTARFQIPLYNDRLCFTTPYPLEIIIPPGPGGEPVSFGEAHFGAQRWPCQGTEPVVVVTDAPRDSIAQDPYELLEIALREDILWLRVGFSGCAADHPFTLYISRAFMESEPVQTWAVLAHDDRGELCQARFERQLRFDLEPLRAEYIRAYGAPGQVRLKLYDFHGDEHEVLFGP